MMLVRAFEHAAIIFWYFETTNNLNLHRKALLRPLKRQLQWYRGERDYFCLLVVLPPYVCREDERDITSAVSVGILKVYMIK